MKTYIKMILFLAVTTLLLQGCGSSNVENGTDQQTQNEQTQNEQAQGQQPAETQETEKEFYTIGDTVNVEGMEITVSSASFANPAAYSEPKNGKVMTILINVKNIDQDNGFVDNTEFVIAGASGKQYEAYYGFDDANMFTAELKKGNTVDGKLAFDVAEEEEYILYYEPMFSFNENAEIKFKITANDLK